MINATILKVTIRIIHSCAVLASISDCRRGRRKQNTFSLATFPRIARIWTSPGITPRQYLANRAGRQRSSGRVADPKCDKCPPSELGGGGVRPLHLALSRTIFLRHVLCAVTRTLMPPGWSGYWSSGPSLPPEINHAKRAERATRETKFRPLISDIVLRSIDLFN